MPNWIVWNRTAFDIETLYFCESEFFEIEQFFYILTVYLY